MKEIRGSFTRAKGFLAGSSRAGLKTRAGALDIAVFVSEVEAAAAGVFTQNPMCGAPVKVSRARLRQGRARAIVMNAGNANDCTGQRGIRDAERMSALAGNALGVDGEEVLVASTGIIGEPLPMGKIAEGIEAACQRLGRTLRHDRDAAKAIMTTDTRPKERAVIGKIGGASVTVGGMVKGSGMIAPNMATMLAFISTDCAIAPATLASTVRKVNEDTFNCVTVDGHTSPSDSVFVLANGCAGNRRISKRGKDLSAFEGMLGRVMEGLAKDIAADGEGATKFIEVTVRAARSRTEAHAAAMAIANSPLVKTAMFGEDPNWGRIVTAAGNSGSAMVAEKVSLSLNGVRVFSRGRPLAAKEELAARMREREIRVVLDMGSGEASRTVWTCDLTNGYVRINAEYHT